MSENANNTNNTPVTPVPEPVFPTTYAYRGALTGRKEILTTEKAITPENIMSVLIKALAVHAQNKSDIQFLYDYVSGLQPILQRQKEIRPEICNKIVENHASEIVDFFTGYIFGDPIVYAGRAENDCSDEIQQLNAWNQENDKSAQDIDLGTWMNICGTGYVIAIPQSDGIEDDDISAPYVTAVLDPREAFVVYYNGIQKIPVMGVKIVNTSQQDVLYPRLYCVYTRDSYYEIPSTDLGNNVIPTRYPHSIGRVPIVEFPLNLMRRGRIEPVIPLLDAMNCLASNRMDGIEQFIQSLLLFRNVDIDSKDLEALLQMGAIKYKDTEPSMPGEVRYITAELNQDGAQTLKDDLYMSVLIISGMPNRNQNTGGDNGVAVVYRDGWSAAETKAKETERYYIRAEKELLKVILRIVKEIRQFDIHLNNIEVKFTRKNYENTQTKSQVLTTMLNNNKIAPRLAFVYSGLFSDPEAAWKESMQYYDEVKAEEVQPETEENNGGNENGEG